MNRNQQKGAKFRSKNSFLFTQGYASSLPIVAVMTDISIQPSTFMRSLKALILAFDVTPCVLESSVSILLFIQQRRVDPYASTRTQRTRLLLDGQSLKISCENVAAVGIWQVYVIYSKLILQIQLM